MDLKNNTKVFKCNTPIFNVNGNIIQSKNMNRQYGKNEQILIDLPVDDAAIKRTKTCGRYEKC